jgi:hypothetical protein
VILAYHAQSRAHVSLARFRPVKDIAMSRIFLSHSSANNAEAIAVRDWMQTHGWDDIFLDLDPERGLKAGERWQDALKRAAERCEMVIFLVSPVWAASKWCLAEFLLANAYPRACGACDDTATRSFLIWASRGRSDAGAGGSALT